MEPIRELQLRASKLFADYSLRSLSLSRGTDISGQEVSDVEIRLATDIDDPGSDHRVSFKVLDRGADSHRYISSVVVQPRLELSLTDEGRRLSTEDVSAKALRFIDSIDTRVAKIHQEQSILSTQPVGKTFELNHKTRFTVLADDGAGHLTISIQGKDGEQQAKLAANDLLDGLYAGFIVQL